MINWNIPQGSLGEFIEGSNFYQEISVDDTNAIITKISGDFPNGLDLTQLGDGRCLISGILPIINENKEYFFTLRALNNDTEESSQIYYSINVLNKKTIWDKEYIPELSVIETIFTSINLNHLINEYGNEEFVKIKGELPENLELNSNGFLTGILEENLKTTQYFFTIGVKRNGEFIADLEKEFTLNIIRLTDFNKPVWISDEGNIGEINYKDKSNLFVVGYDPNGRNISYKLGINDNLPSGLKLNPLTGQITGTCETIYNIDWKFDVIISNGVNEVSRSFFITTNDTNNKDKIDWITNSNLGDMFISEDILVNLKVKSEKPVTFTIIDGKLPDGLSMRSNGEIFGSINYQDKKLYKFMVNATNGITYTYKEFYINVTKGLGKNAVKAYFYINNENLEDYQNMRTLFDASETYKAYSKKYDISAKPIVDLCRCTTFDKVLIKHLIHNFNNFITFNWGMTEKVNYKVDNEIQYTAFYKKIDEEINKKIELEYPKQPYQKEYVDVEINYLQHNTNTTIIPYGEVYEEYTINDGNEVITSYYFIDETGEKIYVDKEIVYYQEGTRVVVEPNDKVYKEVLESKEYFINENGEKIYVERLNESRAYIIDTNELLSLDEQIYMKKIYYKNEYIDYKYVLRNDKEYEINYASSLMMSNLNTNIVLKETVDSVELMRDEPIIRYFYNNSPKYSVLYGSTQYLREQLNRKIIVEKLNKDKVYYKAGNQELIDDDFTYKEFLINYDEERKVYYTTYNGEERIYKIYSRNLEDSSEELKPVFINDNNNFKEVGVYERFLDTDIEYGSYFVFDEDGNEQDNILFSFAWKPDFKFIIQNGEYFRVKTISNPYIYRPEDNDIGYDKTIVLPFVTDEDIFTNEDLPYIRFFDIETENLPEWKTQYYPTLDLFYSNPNTNIVALTQINNNERKGDYWVGRKHIFYELHFEFLFNNIDNYSIPFYTTSNNENSPDFLLI